MIDTVNQRLALRHQSGNDQTGRCAQIRRHHIGAIQTRNARNRGGIPIDFDVCAQPDQFSGVHKAVFKDRFADEGGALGNAVERHELRLHVGRESRVRVGTHINRLAARRRLECNLMRPTADLTTGFAQFIENSLEIICRSMRQAHAAARRRGGAQIGAGLDAIGHDSMRRAMQGINAFDDDAIGARTGNTRPHGEQAVGKVDDFRLTRGVFNHGFAFRQARRHHQIFRAGHRHHIGDDTRAFQARRPCKHITLLDTHLSAHRL